MLAPDQTAVLLTLLRTQPLAALGTLHGGEPVVSMVPYALLPQRGRLVVHVSALAGHTRDMQASPRVSLMVLAAPAEGVPPQATARASFQCDAARCAPDDPDHAAARQAYLARFPDSAELFSFADFSLFTLAPRHLRLVGGFGRAATVMQPELARLLGGPANAPGSAPVQVLEPRRPADRAAPTIRPMTSALTLRPETPADVDTITALTTAAFAPLAISSHTEQHIVLALRAAGALALSLVAEQDGRVLGHIAFSPLTLSDGTPGWYGLGPVSVWPDHQGRGIGAALVREGLAQLRQRPGARGCCLVGHPGYYGRFGFVHPPGLGLPGVPPEAFFALAFDGALPQGTVAFHPAFQVEGPPDGPTPAP